MNQCDFELLPADREIFLCLAERYGFGDDLSEFAAQIMTAEWFGESELQAHAHRLSFETMSTFQNGISTSSAHHQPL